MPVRFIRTESAKKQPHDVSQIILQTARGHKLLTLGILCTVFLAVVSALPPPLVLERIVNFVGDVDTVEALFTSGIISMIADLCRIASIFAIIFAKNQGLAMILLLDEITANLDSGTEQIVLTAIQDASRNRTVLSISHRLYADSCLGGHDAHYEIKGF